jgi:hypothetical protein
VSKRILLVLGPLLFGLSAEAAGISLSNQAPAWLALFGIHALVNEPERCSAPANLSASPVELSLLPGDKRDCPVVGTKSAALLFSFSHGRGGWFGGHNDTAEAVGLRWLFVVAGRQSIPGDSGSDFFEQRDHSLSVLAVTSRGYDPACSISC